MGPENRTWVFYKNNKVVPKLILPTLVVLLEGRGLLVLPQAWREVS